MPTRDTRSRLQHRRDYPYASCDHLMDCQGVKGGDGGCCDDDSGSSCGSWTEDAASCSGTSGGSASSSLSSGTGKGEKARRKWLESLWSAIDHLAEERKVRHLQQHPVKTILRPPTEYVYVIGMSGLPSKVAVYPKLR